MAHDRAWLRELVLPQDRAAAHIDRVDVVGPADDKTHAHSSDGMIVLDS
ncbi:MAG: hypothetical protein ABI591_10615 [Kofleriaceae bacterium]